MEEKREEIVAHCILLKEQGEESKKVKEYILQQGVSEFETKQIFREADSVFLQNLNAGKNKKKGNRIWVKSSVLLLTLLFLTAVFFGHATVGIILLIIMWASIGSLKVISSKNKFKANS